MSPDARVGTRIAALYGGRLPKPPRFIMIQNHQDTKNLEALILSTPLLTTTSVSFTVTRWHSNPRNRQVWGIPSTSDGR